MRNHAFPVLLRILLATIGGYVISTLAIALGLEIPEVDKRAALLAGSLLSFGVYAAVIIAVFGIRSVKTSLAIVTTFIALQATLLTIMGGRSFL